ncbi:hypothetical protein J4Q44_G00374530 [Coregonus suidteri]|uniref:ENPP1-3/EXOG-like endonuclease/phosphodiesterase domain-containing protein n=1 Tax=Coregonus suidteri TaxID=861788 RepID=A0AAN8KHN3_9TELE
MRQDPARWTAFRTGGNIMGHGRRWTEWALPAQVVLTLSFCPLVVRRPAEEGDVLPASQGMPQSAELNEVDNNLEMVVYHPLYQAGNNDYKISIDSNGVNRGHLFPCSHANDLETQKSTFTLTNIVPQVVSFNGGSWKDMELGKFSEVKECSDFFLEGTTPSLPGILVGGTVKDQNRYKPICQKYKGKYRFATLYDTTNKIPVFSAYTFTGPPPKGRPNQPWMIEPQLNNIKNSPQMSEDKGQSPDHQAGNNDYKNSQKIKSLLLLQQHPETVGGQSTLGLLLLQQQPGTVGGRSTLG